MQSPEQNERDLVATDEMIRNLRAGTIQKIAYGVGAVSGALLLGASLLVWTWKHGNDPEAFKEALRHMPPLTVTVKLEPDSKVTLAQPATVTLANLPAFSQAQVNSGGGNNDPAINTSVTVFKTVKYGDGVIFTGWDFPNGAAKTPTRQFCHYRQVLGGGNEALQEVGKNGTMLPAPNGVKDQSERFARCQWFNGDLS